MEILKRKFELNELKDNDIQVGDVVNLPEFTVPVKVIHEKNKIPLAFDEHTIKETASVYNIKDNKVYLLFDHVLFKSAIDLNNEKKWKDTQLRKYLTNGFQPAMIKAGIPAKDVSLLSKDEVFGENALPFFKNGKNRVSFREDEKSTCFYWLKTSEETASSASFCFAGDSGYSGYYDASDAYTYVRPCFVIEL